MAGDTLRRLYVEQGLTAPEIAACDAFDCTATTVRKYLAEYGLIDEDVDYGRLDDLGDDAR